LHNARQPNFGAILDAAVSTSPVAAPAPTEVHEAHPPPLPPPLPPPPPPLSPPPPPPANQGKNKQANGIVQLLVDSGNKNPVKQELHEHHSTFNMLED
jgi:hypothetical protein